MKPSLTPCFFSNSSLCLTVDNRNKKNQNKTPPKTNKKREWTTRTLDIVQTHRVRSVLVAHLDEVVHVHLLERGQHGGGVLALLQALRDALAHAVHGHAGLRASTGSSSWCSVGGRSGSGNGRLGGGRSGRLGRRSGGLGSRGWGWRRVCGSRGGWEHQAQSGVQHRTQVTVHSSQSSHSTQQHTGQPPHQYQCTLEHTKHITRDGHDRCAAYIHAAPAGASPSFMFSKFCPISTVSPSSTKISST